MITTRDKILSAVMKPTRYTGGELNSVIKNPADVDVRFGFCFADTYEIAMSHLGLKILYHTLNDREDTYCERVFAPWTDMEEEMKKHGMKLFALETGDEITHFDMLGFTLQYELSYSNIVNMLMLADIPVRAKDRDESYPIVCGGGPCAYNAEPVADIFDFFMLGEGEDSIHEVVEEYVKWKKSGKKNKRDYLEAIAEIEGIYVPSFYDVEYNDDNTVKSVTPNNPHAKPKVRKRIMKDFNATYAPETIIVPFGEVVHDRVMLEVMRGCLRGCRFCQAGNIYRPLRERSLEYLKDHAYKMLKSTGHEEISLSSLSSSDYSQLGELVNFLIDEFGSKGINISLPSLRIDAFSLDVMSKVQDIRKSSLTFAPEAGSQRLRDVINKGLTEEVILDGAGQAFEGGWNRVKLYFMLGQPTETEEDMKGIAWLAEKISERYYEVPKEQRNGKCQIVVSTSFFVPKPFTPFQWAQMCTKEEFLHRAYVVNHEIKEQKNKKSIKYNWHEADVTVLEGILARGDRKVAAVVEEVYKNGALFDSWGENFDNDLWMKAFETCGVDPDFYTVRERSLDEVFPWDFIDAGVSKEFLKREWKQAMNETVTPNCRQKCSGCGARVFGGGVCFEGKN